MQVSCKCHTGAMQVQAQGKYSRTQVNAQGKWNHTGFSLTNFVLIDTVRKLELLEGTEVPTNENGHACMQHAHLTRTLHCFSPLTDDQQEAGARRRSNRNRSTEDAEEHDRCEQQTRQHGTPNRAHHEGHLWHWESDANMHLLMQKIMREAMPWQSYMTSRK